MTENTDMAISFDAELTDEQIKAAEANDKEFTLLEPGEYYFRVIKAEKGTYQPTATSKIRVPSPMMTVTIIAESPDGPSNCWREKLIYNQLALFKCIEFFVCIGLWKHGQKGALPWDRIAGKSGKARIGKGNPDKNGRVWNNVEKWLPAPQDEDY